MNDQFDRKIERNHEIPTRILTALVYVCDTMDYARCMLQQNGVEKYEASDLIELTKLILAQNLR